MNLPNQAHALTNARGKCATIHRAYRTGIAWNMVHGTQPPCCCCALPTVDFSWERNRDLEIATATAAEFQGDSPGRSRFLNRGSLPPDASTFHNSLCAAESPWVSTHGHRFRSGSRRVVTPQALSRRSTRYWRALGFVIWWFRKRRDFSFEF